MDTRKNDEKPAPATATGTRRTLLAFATLVIGFSLLVVFAASFPMHTAHATPGVGVTQTPVAAGTLPEAVRMKLKDGGGFGDGLDITNVAVVKNIVPPGAYFGWHQHGGPSWIVVTQGTLTFYDVENGTCAAHPVSAGQAYLDMGDHTHNARNETSTTVENYVVRFLPQGAQTRIDKPAPGVCPF
jgi:quercetin dioxygenase-like cupin family protein